MTPSSVPSGASLGADYQQGEVVLVRFVFSDEPGAKRRPVVILRTDMYQRGRQQAIVAAITSNVQPLLIGDHLIAGWQEAGLLFPSVAIGIVRTVKQAMVERCLGRVAVEDLQAILAQMRGVLGL